MAPCQSRHGLARPPGWPRHGCGLKIGGPFAARNPTPSASTATARSIRPTVASATSPFRKQTSVLGAPARQVTAPASSRSASTRRAPTTRARRAPSAAGTSSERSRRGAQRVVDGRRVPRLGIHRHPLSLQIVAVLGCADPNDRPRRESRPTRRVPDPSAFVATPTRARATTEAAQAMGTPQGAVVLPRLSAADQSVHTTMRHGTDGQRARLLQVVRAPAHGRSVREGRGDHSPGQVEPDERARGVLRGSSGRYGLNDMRPEDVLGFLLLFIFALAWGLAE